MIIKRPSANAQRSLRRQPCLLCSHWLGQSFLRKKELKWLLWWGPLVLLSFQACQCFLINPCSRDLNSHKKNRLPVCACMCAHMYMFFSSSQRGRFEVCYLDSIHVQRYSLERKGRFFIWGPFSLNLTDGPILDNSLPTVPKKCYP